MKCILTSHSNSKLSESLFVHDFLSSLSGVKKWSEKILLIYILVRLEIVVFAVKKKTNPTETLQFKISKTRTRPEARKIKNIKPGFDLNPKKNRNQTRPETQQIKNSKPDHLYHVFGWMVKYFCCIFTIIWNILAFICHCRKKYGVFRLLFPNWITFISSQRNDCI